MNTCFNKTRPLWPSRFSVRIFLASLVCLLAGLCPGQTSDELSLRGPVFLKQPVAVYNNWSAYDELSDNVRLTEALAMKQLGEILRLRKAGVAIDYYMMDAYWFDPKGGYREFRRGDWPNGPERWLTACRQHGIRPGLWLASNTLSQMEPAPEWESSLIAERSAMCLFRGGFLPHLIETMQQWYGRGVRMFKFDFANLRAVTPDLAKQLSRDEIFAKNSEALRQALMDFRRKNPEVVLVGFNGFGGEVEGTFAPIRQTVDPRWLLAFDTMYCGDPRPSDVPMMNFWRSQDVYSDHMVRYYELNGLPLERIDNTGFMVGTTGTCYKRGTAAWKGMLLLEHARGGRMNVYHGNLELIDAHKAAWFAKVQALYLKAHTLGRAYSFGGLPGKEEFYGFCTVTSAGALYTVVNPAQTVRTVSLPEVVRGQTPVRSGRVLFHDTGFSPRLAGSAITLGPEELALVGFGEYAQRKYDLGVEEDMSIPAAIGPLAANFVAQGTNAVAAMVDLPAGNDLRVVMRQFRDGEPCRISRGAPPNGTSLGKVLVIQASQAGREVPVHINYDKAIWSGLSWGVGEIRNADCQSGQPVQIRCLSLEKEPVELKVQAYGINYAQSPKKKQR
jgi:hypothetical protein